MIVHYGRIIYPRGGYPTYEPACGRGKGEPTTRTTNEVTCGNCKRTRLYRDANGREIIWFLCPGPEDPDDMNECPDAATVRTEDNNSRTERCKKCHRRAINLRHGREARARRDPEAYPGKRDEWEMWT